MSRGDGLMGLEPPATGYDGVVQTPGGLVRVHDGVMRVGKNTLHVAEDGTVTDEQDKPLARVVDGKLTPLQQQAQPQPQPQQGAPA